MGAAGPRHGTGTPAGLARCTLPGPFLPPVCGRAVFRRRGPQQSWKREQPALGRGVRALVLLRGCWDPMFYGVCCSDGTRPGCVVRTVGRWSAPCQLLRGRGRQALCRMVWPWAWPWGTTHGLFPSRSFENNWNIYKLLAHQKPSKEKVSCHCSRLCLLPPTPVWLGRALPPVWGLSSELGLCLTSCPYRTSAGS